MRCFLVGLLVLLFPLGPALAKPDLVVKVAPTVVGCNEDDRVVVKYDVTITNNGDKACPGTWYTDLWATYPCSLSTPPEACAAASSANWASSQFGNLAPGQSVTQSVTYSFDPTPSPISYVAYVDSVLDLCPEQDETNNIDSGSFNIPETCNSGPDLIIASASITNDTESPVDVNLLATVTNVGDAPAVGSIHVDFFLNPEEDPTSPFTCQQPPFLVDGDGFATTDATTVGPGESVEVEGKIYGLQAGHYQPIALVNGFQEFEESTVDNNCFDLEPFVQPTFLDKPDLEVSEFEVFLVGSMVSYSVQVTNTGYVPVPLDQPYKVCIWYDHPGGQPGQCAVPSVEDGQGSIIQNAEFVPGDVGLDVNAVADYGTKIGPMDNGCYDFWARVDCDCEIFEVDEKNNDFKFTYCVDLPGPDLAVKLFSAVEHQDADCHSTVQYVVIIQNKGTDPATPPFYVDVFYNSPVQPTLDNIDQLGEGFPFKVLDPIDPGATLKLPPIEWAMPPDGVPAGLYQSWVSVNLDRTLWETGYANNVQAKEINVVGCVPGSPNLGIVNFTAKAKVDTISYFIEYSNFGDKDIAETPPFRVDLFRDRELQPNLGELGDYNQSVEGLSAGGNKTWIMEWEGVPDGCYNAYAVLDTDNVVKESNEGDNIAGPLVVCICSTCNVCAENEYVTEPCYCGDETINAGFCCGGQVYYAGCPAITEGEEQDLYSPESGGTVEFSQPQFYASDCSCRTGQSGGPSGGGFVLLALVAALRIVLARRSRKTFTSYARIA